METWIDYLIPLLVLGIYFLLGRKKKVVRPTPPQPLPTISKKNPPLLLKKNPLPPPRLGVSLAAGSSIVSSQTRRSNRISCLLKRLPNRKDAIILSEILNRRDV